MENCSYKVNNHLDHLYKPRPIHEMLRSGKEMVGQEMECSVLSRSCEHFVISLRYGKDNSRQVRPSVAASSPFWASAWGSRVRLCIQNKKLPQMM